MYKITGTSSYLDKVKWRVDNYNLEPCGYFHNTNWGSLRDAGNAAFLAALFHSESSSSTAYSFAKSNVDFILGSHGYISADAPANFSFLIGYDQLGGSYPQHPHHGASFGKSSNAWSHYTKEEKTPGTVNFEYELKGGLAGGPEGKCSNFSDNISNYISSEYCSYYNAGFTGAVAYINKIENKLVLSMTDKFVEQDFFVLPNPASDMVTVNMGSQLCFVTFTDSSGREVYKSEMSGKTQVDVSNLQAGIYTVKSDLNQKVKRFVKN
jgi:hypothetical protein